MSDQEGNRTQKHLKILQPTATDVENLVGRPSNPIKNQLTEVTSVEIARTNLLNKAIQVDLNETNSEKSSNKQYYKDLAIKREKELFELSKKKEELLQIIDDLKERKRGYIKLLNETYVVIEAIKKIPGIADNDTGIDVNDVSNSTIGSNSDENEEDDE